MNNKMKVKAMMKKPWWSYALLLAGMFLYFEGCSILFGSEELSMQIPVILFALFMHGTSLSDLSKRILLKDYNGKVNNDKNNNKLDNKSLKDKACLIANVFMQILLVTFAVICYKKDVKLTNIFLFDISAIAVYFVVSVLSYKLYSKRI